MTTFILACRLCLTEFEIDKRDTIKGWAHWSICPGCRKSGVDSQFLHLKKEPQSGYSGYSTQEKAAPGPQIAQSAHPKNGPIRTKWTALKGPAPNKNLSEPVIHAGAKPEQMLVNVGDRTQADEQMLRNVDIPTRAEPTKTSMPTRAEAPRDFTKLYRNQPPKDPANFTKPHNPERSEGGDAA